MALTAAGWQNYIVTSLRGGETLDGVIEAIWESCSYWQATPRLQFLHSKREAIMFLIGNLDEEPAPPPVEGDQQARESVRLSALRLLLQKIEAEIANWRRSGAPAVAQLTAQAIVPSPSYAPDANDSSRRGDPNKIVNYPNPPVLP